MEIDWTPIVFAPIAGCPIFMREGKHQKRLLRIAHVWVKQDGAVALDVYAADTRGGVADRWFESGPAAHNLHWCGSTLGGSSRRICDETSNRFGALTVVSFQ